MFSICPLPRYQASYGAHAWMLSLRKHFLTKDDTLCNHVHDRGLAQNQSTIFVIDYPHQMNLVLA